MINNLLLIRDTNRLTEQPFLCKTNITISKLFDLPLSSQPRKERSIRFCHHSEETSHSKAVISGGLPCAPGNLCLEPPSTRETLRGCDILGQRTNPGLSVIISGFGGELPRHPPLPTPPRVSFSPPKFLSSKVDENKKKCIKIKSSNLTKV